MGRTRATTLLATAALALACPAFAHAQSAGDNQYQDPFGNSPPPSSTSPQHSSSSHNAAAPAPNSSSSPAATNVTPATTAATPLATTAPSTGTAATSTGATTLPRTGVDTVEEALIGASLLLGGFGLRRRARD